MGRKRHKPEEIVAKLRQVDVLTTQGHSVAEAIRSIGVTEVTYYRWRQEFLEAGRNRLAGDREREATRDEVKSLRQEAVQLQEARAEAMLENRLLKKSRIADGESDT